ncbi:hypothetical protein HPB52_025172 [Rhipicephalus sanguineus]|uniref:Aldehyde dehydrogenase domain-containing protein n=1 Tax=Rhipicephalus sanguineus TaxID=34632 RepID=A0A9D4TDB3_RHISA|nr:hypothetical protein HPB52_025172 [Rhipicephalus sanguineus]
MSRCATPYLKRLSLELGDKSPLIIFADCDLDSAVRQGLNSVFFHKGENGIAAGRLSVEDSPARPLRGARRVRGPQDRQGTQTTAGRASRLRAEGRVRRRPPCPRRPQAAEARSLPRTHHQAGSCFINCYNKIDVAAPFGGFKQSGYGKDLGQATLKDYLQLKCVTVEC